MGYGWLARIRIARAGAVTTGRKASWCPAITRARLTVVAGPSALSQLRRRPGRDHRQAGDLFDLDVRGDKRGWFKGQLVRTAISAARAVKERWPRSTIVWAEPLIHIAPHDHRRQSVRGAKANLQGMYEAYDWIMGLTKPELGGDPSLVDAVGWNYYPHNQWYWKGPTIPMGHHEYRPLADMLVEMTERYGKPLFLSETGAEGTGKPSWLHYVCNEVRDAMGRGADIGGACWSRMTAYRGWDTSRHAEPGLFSPVVANGTRHVDERLLAEFELQREQFASAYEEQRRVAGGRR